MATFDELFAEHRLTPAERRELVFYLASIRSRRLIETLLGGNDGGKGQGDRSGADSAGAQVC